MARDRCIGGGERAVCAHRWPGRRHSVNFRHESGEPVQLALDPWFDAAILRAEEMELGDLALCVVRGAIATR